MDTPKVKDRLRSGGIQGGLGTMPGRKMPRMRRGRRGRVRAAAPDIAAITKAIGTDQTPNGPKPMCNEKFQVSFKDDSGAEKGVLGFCGGLGAKDTIDNADFGPSGRDRAGIQVT